ncbi:unnamed protein product [Tuber aestivum]|uniref:Uncharacterized protein n=1 Tax=Tuber aestivum TaxID=59557 RepID=A0A292Q8L9_9PEZI|nr:unnamed protein product [Tuber aestivum]
MSLVASDYATYRYSDGSRGHQSSANSTGPPDLPLLSTVPVLPKPATSLRGNSLFLATPPTGKLDSLVESVSVATNAPFRALQTRTFVFDTPASLVLTQLISSPTGMKVFGPGLVVAAGSQTWVTIPDPRGSTYRKTIGFPVNSIIH